MTGADNGEIVLSATIEPGWHLYASDFPAGQGPQPLEIDFEIQGVKLEGKPVQSVAPVRQMDEIFEMELSWWTQEVTFRQKFTAVEPAFAITANL